MGEPRSNAREAGVVSATNRGAHREAADNYPTPAWCVRRLLERVWLPGGLWLEPAAGSGAIVRAVNAYRMYCLAAPVVWVACDVRPECRDDLSGVVDDGNVHIEDFLTRDFGCSDWDCVISNPPYSLAQEFVTKSLELAPFVAMLLRLNFLASGERAPFFRSEQPDIYVLPNRPSFTANGKTDASEYCWMVWTPERGRKHGRVEVLAETPPAERGVRKHRRQRNRIAGQARAQ
jgi:hypothetical protein